MRLRLALNATLGTLVLLVAASTALPSQSPPTPAPRAAQGDTLAAQRLQVSLLTFGQGTPVFERFGHNAIRISDQLLGLDISWNCGMFSFDEPNFLGRFLSGTSRYWVEGFGTVPLLAYYQEHDRQTVEQVLNLSGAQKLELLRFVRWNELEENKFYPYDYFRDNCSTRVRDALDRVLGGALKRAWSDSLSAHSFRSEALRLTEGAPLSRLGIDIALGPPADRRMTAWEEMYVPMRLRDRIRGITVPGPDGAAVALVQSERVVFNSTREPEAAAPAVLPGQYVAVALAALVPLALFGGLAFLSALRGRWPAAQRVARLVIAVVASVWYAGSGLIGVAVLFMELFSKHIFWYGNWNVLLLSPLGLAAAWFVPRAVVGGRGARAARWLGGLCGASALVALVAAMSGATGQSAGAVAVAFAPATMYLGLLVPALTLIRPART